MTHIKFTPWTGAQYESGLHGNKILILGESPYRPEDVENDINDSSLTSHRIQTQIDGDCSYKFWTNIAIALLNRKPTLADKKAFWHSVAYYNYVQESVGNGPRIPPSKDAWKRGEEAFLEVLSELKPSLVIVLGYRLWARLPALGRLAGAMIDSAPVPDTWIYPYPGGSCLAFNIRHPSSGFSGWNWHPHIMKACRQAHSRATV